LKEERKEKKISHPNRFVDAPTKINSPKNQLRKVVKVVCFVCLVEICQTMAPLIVLLGLAKSHLMNRGENLPNHGAPHCAFGIFFKNHLMVF
jgi:hypothetical protein